MSGVLSNISPKYFDLRYNCNSELLLNMHNVKGHCMFTSRAHIGIRNLWFWDPHWLSSRCSSSRVHSSQGHTSQATPLTRESCPYLRRKHLLDVHEKEDFVWRGKLRGQEVGVEFFAILIFRFRMLGVFCRRWSSLILSELQVFSIFRDTPNVR